MSILFQIINAIICFCMAYIDKEKMDDGYEPNHAVNGLIHIVFVGLAAFAFNPYIGAAILFESRLVFDSSLSLLRRLGIGYVSPNPKSKIDRLEKWVFGNDGITPKILYIIIAFVLNNL